MSEGKREGTDVEQKLITYQGLCKKEVMNVRCNKMSGNYKNNKRNDEHMQINKFTIT